MKFCDGLIALRDERLRKRLKREAHLLAKAQHPSIPYVITHGEVPTATAPVLFTVMEFIEGPSLEALTTRAKLIERGLAVRIVRQVLGALACAHNHEIVHRDVKPANILVDPAGHAYVIDFSIGVSLTERAGLTRATQDGEHLGTAEYMAPEQSQDLGKVDHRADIYSVGVVLFELLVGHTRLKLIDSDQMFASLPPGLQQIIRRACALDPDQRWQSADDFGRELDLFDVGLPAPLVRSGKALCVGPVCPKANWSTRGYYRGPRVIEDCSQPYCEACGAELKYSCGRCHQPVSGDPFCASCGQVVFVVPECERCGSWLMRGDVGKDTASHGCQKCRRSLGAPPPDDDFPF